MAAALGWSGLGVVLGMVLGLWPVTLIAAVLVTVLGLRAVALIVAEALIPAIALIHGLAVAVHAAAGHG